MRIRLRGRSDGLLHLAALQAAGTDVGPGRRAAQKDANLLEVRVETALRGYHRMAPVVTETRLLSANGADLGHRPRMVANRRNPSPGAMSWCQTRGQSRPG